MPMRIKYIGRCDVKKQKKRKHNKKNRNKKH